MSIANHRIVIMIDGLTIDYDRIKYRVAAIGIVQRIAEYSTLEIHTTDSFDPLSMLMCIAGF